MRALTSHHVVSGLSRVWQVTGGVVLSKGTSAVLKTSASSLAAHHRPPTLVILAGLGDGLVWVCLCSASTSWCCHAALLPLTCQRLRLELVVYVLLPLLSPCRHLHSKDYMVRHDVVCQRISHHPRHCYLLLAGVGAPLCTGDRSCIGLGQRHVRALSFFLAPTCGVCQAVWLQVVSARNERQVAPSRSKYGCLSVFFPLFIFLSVSAKMPPPLFRR
jgi:hypothetical protein